MSKTTKYCTNCGLEIDQKVRFCPRCGAEQLLTLGETRKHTRAWYVVPLLLGIVGGIIGYIVIKDDDKKMATNLLITGTVMMFVVPIVGGLIFWTWLTTMLRGLTAYTLLVNKKAPLFTLTDINGANCSLNEFEGKIVVIDFFATWCGPCKTQMPQLSQICEKYNISEVVVMSISVDPSSDTVEKLKQFASDNNMTWTVARGTAEVTKNYGIAVIPTLLIMDQNGTIRYAHVGSTPASTLLSEIDSLLRQ